MPRALESAESRAKAKTEWITVSSVLLTFLILGIRAAFLRSLWFDELASYNLATQPTMQAFFRALPYDGNPPLYFLLARLFLATPLKTELALRLPSVLSWVFGSLLAYVFVRRATSRLLALLAMSLFLGSTMEGTAALDARPYALLLFATACAVCAWQMAAFGPNRRLGHLLLAAAAAAAIMSHQYGLIYVGVSVGVGESIRMLRARRLYFSVLAAMFIGFIPIAFTVPATLRVQAPLLTAIRLCPVFQNHPRFAHLSIYERTLPTFVGLIFALCLIAAMLFGRKQMEVRPVVARTRLEDLGVSVSLALLIPIMLIVTKLGTGYFVERYAVGAALGVAILTPILLSFLPNSAIAEYVPRFLILYSLAIGLLTFVMTRPYLSRTLEGVQSDPLFRSAPVAEQIVIGDPFTYVPTWWYSSAEDRKRIHYLSDLRFALMQRDPVPENSLALEQPFGAPPMDRYQDFVETHGEFVLFCAGDWRPNWIKQRLLDEGWILTPIGSEEERELYLVKRRELTAN